MRARDRRPSKAHWQKSYAEFRARLVQARADAGMTQRQAAERLGRPQSFVAKSETGERRVDVVELAQFAVVYRKKITYFMPRGAIFPSL